VSLAGWLRRRRRANPPEPDPARAWRSTAGELAGAFVTAAGVTRTPPPVTSPPIEKICADLHRINGEIAKVLADPRLPARYHRLLAASWAYDAALRDACRAVGVDPPPRQRLDQIERLATEAALTEQGVHW
jgi:hypothetical protein